MLHPCKFSLNPHTGLWDTVQTKKCYADANANVDANRIRTKNNMTPSPSVGDIILNTFRLKTYASV